MIKRTHFLEFFLFNQHINKKSAQFQCKKVEIKEMENYLLLKCHNLQIKCKNIIKMIVFDLNKKIWEMPTEKRNSKRDVLPSDSSSQIRVWKDDMKKKERRDQTSKRKEVSEGSNVE